MRQHFHAARRGSQSAYKASQRFTIATGASKSRRALPLPIAHSQSRLCFEQPATLHAESDAPKSTTFAALSCAHLFKLRRGKAGGVTGARRASRRIFAAQYLMGLGSEHGAAEGVSQQRRHRRAAL
jgi:hypothetical protein